jgi:hypothetical protein
MTGRTLKPSGGKKLRQMVKTKKPPTGTAPPIRANTDKAFIVCQNTVQAHSPSLRTSEGDLP